MAKTIATTALLLVVSLLLVAVTVDAQRLPLTTWRFESLNGSVRIDDARVPGTSHMHLLDAGVIEDPYLRYNERAYQWIARETWVYETHVDVRADASLAHSKLVFEQLDGVARVFLNGQLLATTANAFLTYAFDVEKLLVRGRNIVRVVFAPPLDYARTQSERYPYPVPATQNYNTWAEPTHRSFIRKAGSDFGWDWGPAFATTGIAGAAFLELGATAPTLQNLAVVQRFASSSSNNGNSSSAVNLSAVHITVAVTIDSKGQQLDNVTFAVLLDGVLRAHTTASVGHNASADDVELELTLEQPTLWWPAGYGTPHLYNLSVTAENAQFHAALHHPVGVRHVALVQQPTAAGGVAGETFYFAVNNVPVFVKGANWIPTDSFPTRVAPSTARNLIRSAYEANMNMIRVWGGGRYESELFYAECDRLGLLVWQELMFACGMYPRDAAFLALAAAEVRAQVLRLRKFTSIAMWGGNNENENMMEQFAVNDFIPTWPFNRDVAVADYTKLFVDIVPPLVAELDATRPFVDTSPSNGLYSIDPFVKRWGSVNDIAYGDVHFYDYASDCQAPETFPSARFISEFGFQSAPSLLSLQDVASADDVASFQAFWRFLKFRERHANGTAEMLKQLQRRFVVPFPFNDEQWLALSFETAAADRVTFGLNATQRIDAYLYLTQLQQGLCYQTAIRKWRRGKHTDLGMTMGVLYWQLNDIWQGTSWSSVEFSGRWKSLHYVVKREFAPLLLSVHMPRDDATTVHVFAVSDLDRVLTLEIDYEVRRTATGELVHTMTDSVALQPLESKQIRVLSVGELLQPRKTTCTATTCFLVLQCRAASLSAREAASLCSDVHQFFAPYKDLELGDGVIDVVDVQAVDADAAVAANAFNVTIHSSAFVALFVSLESAVARGFWSDSAFLLPANSSKTLVFTRLEDIARHEDDGDASLLSADAFARTLRVKWLQQIYRDGAADNDNAAAATARQA